ncbi:hypothetical protein ABVK25_006533 [Lepraria finkii]|uniref:Uncharacterized protein n=1 Tax=Lepraria finkii TaxID=1340010 RepID=A0ABR4B700_9LECA
MAPVQTLVERSIQQLEADDFSIVGSHKTDTQNIERRPRTFSNDEEEGRISVQVSKEERGFRSAKSLEQSTVKREEGEGLTMFMTSRKLGWDFGKTQKHLIA